MDLLKKTKDICQENNIKPTRSRGQNFLVKESIYDDIIESSELKSDDVVLEVGPGLGFLTRKLANKVKKVYAVELDEKLAKLLEKNLKEEKISNVEVVNINALDFDFYNLGYRGSYKIVANLPYNISSIFLRRFLSDFAIKPDLLVLMLQKEVAKRIIAQKGEMNLLAISVQFYADAQIIQDVVKENFWPIPQVNSAVIKIKRNLDLVIDKKAEKSFFRLAKAGFGAKRKMLKNNLANFYKLKVEEVLEIFNKIGLADNVRAQDLDLLDWKNLNNFLD